MRSYSLKQFGTSLSYKRVEKLGDRLEPISRLVDWEEFRKFFERVKNKVGRPPYDPVLMVKVLVLQSWYGISDEELEYQVADRISFQKFFIPQFFFFIEIKRVNVGAIGNAFLKNFFDAGIHLHRFIIFRINQVKDFHEFQHMVSGKFPLAGFRRNNGKDKKRRHQDQQLPGNFHYFLTVK